MRGKRDETFRLVMNEAEKSALERLAERDGNSQAAILRRLLRAEARERGLWPPTKTTEPHREAGAYATAA